MAAGIMIMGSSGAGKTTLGKMAAERLGFTFVDIDEYINPLLKNVHKAGKDQPFNGSSIEL